MDLKARQLWSSEQEVVLETLARAAGRPGCKFLEVGSWCGDSTLVIGGVAREYAGHVYCVDWWKGNIGTELADIAAAEDVFAAFWNRMKRAGLEDVVVPIRASSAVAAQVLAGGTFDLAFLDADHSYDGIQNDLRHYAPLVRRHGGILCGHDCEGRIDDYDCDFLETGKRVDFYQSVHCGVVLAVGQAFRDYSIEHGIWSVRAEEGESWKPTHLTYPGIAHRRQPASIPPIGYSKSHMLFRYGRLVYAVPSSLAGIDITADDETNRVGLPSAPSLRELEQRIGEKVSAGSGPILVESYHGYNLVRFEERLYALAQRAGPLILTQLSDVELEKLQEAGDCVIADSLIEIKRILDRRPAEPPPEPPPTTPWDDDDPHLVEESYRGHNIIYYRGAWYGLGQEEGAFEPRKIQDGRYRRCFTGDSADAVRAAIQGERRLYRRMIGMAKKIYGLARR